jgi:hypothetical protein
MPDLLDITIEDQIIEADREVNKRREVYDRLCKARQMNRGRADRQIDLMMAIAATLRRVRDEAP